MSLRHDLSRLVHELDEEANAAADLWSWLPSHKAAEKHHGDYASEFRPSNANVMMEASKVLAEAAGYKMSDEARREWFGCPCGEEHADPTPATETE